MANLRPGGVYLGSEMAKLRPKMTDWRLGRVNLKPGKAGLESEKANLRPGIIGLGCLV